MSSMNEVVKKGNHELVLAEASKLIERVEQAYEQSEAVHELERGLFRQLLELGYQLLELFFSLCGTGDRGAQLQLSDGREVNRLERERERQYQSVFGCHQLQRVVYGSGEGQKIEYAALDQQVQLPASKFSYLLQEWDQALAVEQPYGQVSETMERIFGFRQSVHSLERMNQQLSQSVEPFWEQRPAPALAKDEQLIVCSGDGKGVVIRGAREETPEGEPSAAGSPSTGDGKKMALIGAVYTIEPYVRTPQQVLEALFSGADSSSKPPTRPKPLAQYVRASFERDGHDKMVPSYACIFSWLDEQQRQRNPTAQQPVIVLMDGQLSLWNAAARAFKGTETVEILDLMHALGYLWDAAELFHPSQSKGPCPDALKQQRLLFVKHQAQRLLNGQVQTLIRSLNARRTRLSAARRETLDDIVGYFRNNAPRMNYDQYLNAGYPIASGVIEGACRHIICDRMERSGMRWVVPGAKAMLGLRCIGINQDWGEFMRFHVQRETQRLYPLQAANDPDNSQRLAA